MPNKELLELEKEALIKRLNYALDASGDGIWDWTPANGITVFSKAWEEMLGYEVGELASLASEWSDRLHPEDVAWVFAEIGKVTQSPDNGDTFTHEYRFRNKTGEYLWIQNKAKVVERNEKGEASRVVGTHSNITERKRAELVIQESEAKFKNSFEASPIPFALNDEAGNIINLNAAFNKTFGYTSSDLATLNDWWPLAYPDLNYRHWVAREWEKRLDTMLQNDSAFEPLELKIRCKDGSTKVVLASAAILEKSLKGLHQVILVDITERKQAEKIIKKSEADLKEEQSMAKLGRWELNLITSKLDWSDSVFKIFEIDKKQFESTYNGFLNTIHPDDRQLVDDAYTHSIKTKQPYEIEHRLQMADGRIKWVKESCKTDFDEKGKGLMSVGIIQDITEQKKIEQALKDSELRLTSIFENSPAFIFEVDTNFKYTFLNKIQPGFKYEDIIGQSIFKFIPEEFQEPYRKLYKNAIETGSPQSSEIRGFGSFAEPAWYSVTINPFIRSGELIGFIGISSDITALKKAKIELIKSKERAEESEKKLLEAQELSHVGSWEYLTETDTVTWSKELFNIFERPQELGAPKYSEQKPFYTKESFKQLEKAVQDCIERGFSYHLQLDIITSIGSTKQIISKGQIKKDSNGKILGCIGTAQDITEQKKSEQALKESELRLSLATKAGGVGVWDWDIVNNILTWDDQMFTLYGVKRDQFSNAYEAWYKGVYEPDREWSNTESELAINGDKEFNTEFRIQTPNGDIRNIRALATVLRNKEGKPIRMIGTNWDITKEKEILRQIEVAKEQAEAANKAKSEFLANMSHEIRTPLNGVIGFTELLSNTPLNPIQQQYANNANLSGITLLEIINDILDFSKIEAGMLELEVMKTDMVELLENSIDIVKFSAADKKLELLLDFDPSMPSYAHIDPIRTKQILANLLSNAVKFTQKGEVALRAVYQALEGKKGKLSISVRDTGIGITEDQQSKLFKSFSQADNSTTRKYGGTGLGLVISQMIAAKMGSKIKIDSTPNVGSTFSFDIITDFEQGEKLDTTQLKVVKRGLNIDDKDNSLSQLGKKTETIHQQATEKPVKVSNTTAKIRILIAEDNSLNMMLTKTMISKLIPNCECYEAKNGLEAIEQYQSILPDLIFMDIQMPELDGTEATKKIRELEINKSKQVPIIALTAGALKEEKDKCLSAGMDDFITKPIESSKIKAVLNKFLEQEKRPILISKI